MNLKQQPHDSIFFENPLEEGVTELIIYTTNSTSLTIDLDNFKLILDRMLCMLTDTEATGLILRFAVPLQSMELKELFLQAKEKSQFKKKLFEILNLMNGLDKLNKPIVSIIDKPLSGLGFTLSLLGNKIISSDPKVKVGFPEGAYSILLGLGSVVNLKSKIGIVKSFEVLTKGKLYGVDQALELNLLDQSCPSEEEAQSWAMDYILQKNKQDVEESKESETINLDEEIQKLNKQANLHIPAHVSCFIIFNTGEFLGKEEQLTMELVQFEYILNCRETEAMVRTMYYAVQNARNYQAKTPYDFQQLTVLGAGMMGAGIAYEGARAGLDVQLKDVSMEAAERGKSYSENVCSKLIQLGKMTADSKDLILNRIHPKSDLNGLNHQDIIIEAVFEDETLKAQVIQESLPALNKNGIFASNTTSLPISNLAKNVADPDRFIGLHFFSPVDRMELVEIIRGKETDDETLDKALQFVSKLKKTPIVVNDGPAFFTSRIFFNYLLEGITLLMEGVSVQQVDKLAKEAGFAVGPLAVLDEITLDLMLHVYYQLPSLHNSQKRAYAYLKKLTTLGRHGRKSGLGFYDYSNKEIGKVAWQDPDLVKQDGLPSPVMIKYRLLHVLALDSFRCLESGVLTNPTDGDVGSVLGIGYAMHTGGVFSHIDQVGIQNFVNDCLEFQRFGEQWEVPHSLKELARTDFKFYSGFKSNW
ncbi:3-hydroxyacyl-CoA dehydrogenase NAD-binding domain-containing protein [Sphingobacterium kyonggiense]